MSQIHNDCQVTEHLLFRHTGKFLEHKANYIRLSMLFKLVKIINL